MGGSIAMVLVVAVGVPLVGGPAPGRIFERTTATECRGYLAKLKAVPDERLRSAEISVKWIWSSDRYGWGCALRYTDGSTGSLVLPGPL